MMHNHSKCKQNVEVQTHIIKAFLAGIFVYFVLSILFDKLIGVIGGIGIIICALLYFSDWPRPASEKKYATGGCVRYDSQGRAMTTLEPREDDNPDPIRMAVMQNFLKRKVRMVVMKNPKKKRGCKFYFLVDKILNETEKNKFGDKLISTEILKENFQGIDATYPDKKVKNGWTLIKVCCPISTQTVKISENQSFYENLFEKYTQYVGNLFLKNNIKVEIFDFRIMFKVYPKEEPDEFLPLCSLDNITTKIIGKSLKTSPPNSHARMIAYFTKLNASKKGKEGLYAYLKLAKERGGTLFVSWGVRSKYTVELEIYLPPKSKEEEIAEMNNAAIKLKNEGNPGAALIMYDSILAKYPDNTFALINKGIALKNVDRVLEAIALYNRVLEIEPDNFGALANKGTALFNINKFREAIKCYDLALKVKPHDPDMIQNKKYALAKLNDKKKLPSTEALINAGLVALRLEDYDTAINCVDTVLKIDPKNKRAKILKEHTLSRKSLKLIAQGDYIDAITVIDEVIKLNPNAPVDYVNKGLCFERLKNLDAALENYKKALKLDNNNSLALNNIGFVLFSKGRFEEAIGYFDKALKINPHNILAYNNKQLALKMLSL